MKRLIILLLAFIFLAGCAGAQNEHEGEVENTIDQLPPFQTQSKYMFGIGWHNPVK